MIDLLIERGDQLEEQVRGVLIERNVTDLFDDDDDDELVAADLFQLGLEPVGMMGRGEARDPVAGGVKEHRVAGMGGLDTQTDRKMRLADAGRTEQDYVLRFRDGGASSQVGQHMPRGARSYREADPMPKPTAWCSAQSPAVEQCPRSAHPRPDTADGSQPSPQSQSPASLNPKGVKLQKLERGQSSGVTDRSSVVVPERGSALHGPQHSDAIGSECEPARAGAWCLRRGRFPSERSAREHGGGGSPPARLVVIERTGLHQIRRVDFVSDAGAVVKVAVHLAAVAIVVDGGVFARRAAEGA